MTALRALVAGTLVGLSGARADQLATAARPGATVGSLAAVRVTAPLVCTRGPADQQFRALLTLPPAWPTGQTLLVRIGGISSGKISHGGLHYIHDMTTTFLVPAGTRYVAGSARVIPGTGTANVRVGARAWSDEHGVHLALPGHVENGGSYTPPTLEFAVDVHAPPGATLSLSFEHYQVTAHVFLLGDLDTVCVPRPRPYTLGVTRVTVPPSSS